MNPLLEKIGLLGILPVAVVQDESRAAELGRTLLTNGLPVIEVTFRTDAAAEVIRAITKEVPAVLVGAGTVLTVADVRSAVDAGARFIVSPGFNPKVVDYCLESSIPVVPGVVTPTEIQYALERELEVVKLFPAEACGGLSYLKAISAPYRNLRYIPTGGIDQSSLLSWLRFPKVLACGGSWMVPPDLIAAGEFETVGVLTREAVASMLGFDLRHVGMNIPSAGEARTVANELTALFGFGARETSGSYFVGTQFEVLKRNYLGTHGHIASATNFIDRAIAHLALKNIGIREETRNEKDGKLLTVYLDVEVGGYAVHLVQI